MSTPTRLRILNVVDKMVFATDPENRTESVGTPYEIVPDVKLEVGMEVKVEIVYPKNEWEPIRLIKNLC